MVDRPSPSKVAIPHRKITPSKVGKQRVPKACDNCRVRKVRCSGEQPCCQNCASQSMPCTYPQARKDRLKDATERISQLVGLLEDLSTHVDNDGQQKIDELLVSLGEYASESSIAIGTVGTHSKRRLSLSEESGDPNPEARVAGSVGSNGDVDLVDEDLFRSRESRATGFVGQNSEVQWLRSLKTRMNTPRPAIPTNPVSYTLLGNTNRATAQPVDTSHVQHKPFQSRNIFHVSDSTFYLDADDLEVDAVVDPYELPPPEIAEALFECYIRTVHPSFPILPDTFEAQFRKYNESIKRNRPYQIPESWQATLNLVFAIGAQYSHLAHAQWRSDERDHLVYMTRATRLLGLDKLTATFSKPTLSLIQGTGLLSIYYLAIGQVSRAWMMIGVSLRLALAVGLHLRNDDQSALPSKKEHLIRTWWSLNSIENLLCTLIGRPCVIPKDQCTVPLPTMPSGRSLENKGSAMLRNQNHLESNSFPPTSKLLSSRADTEIATRASFLGACVTIAAIIEKALSKLYSPQTFDDSWKQIQKEIDTLSKELDEWVAAARLAGLEPVNSVKETHVHRERLLLSFQYHSTKLLIYRPCLCRLERRIVGQSDASVDFNQKTAEACVKAAQAVTGLFPDEPDQNFIYQQSPWWCIVHNIMQAIAVFLLELSFGRTHMANPDGTILQSIKKLIRWLEYMSVSNTVARRAHEVVMDIISTGAPQLHIDISEILAQGKANLSEPFSPYGPPGNSVFPQYQGGLFPQSGWETPSSNHPAVTQDLGTQYNTPLWGHRPAQDFEENLPDGYFAQEPNLHMPPIFGNPFYASFDSSNPLEGQFTPNAGVTGGS